MVRWKQSLDTNGQESGQAGAGPLAVMKSVPNPVRLNKLIRAPELFFFFPLTVEGQSLNHWTTREL